MTAHYADNLKLIIFFLQKRWITSEFDLIAYSTGLFSDFFLTLRPLSYFKFLKDDTVCLALLIFISWKPIRLIYFSFYFLITTTMQLILINSIFRFSTVQNLFLSTLIEKEHIHQNLFDYFRYFCFYRSLEFISLYCLSLLFVRFKFYRRNSDIV